MTILNFSEMGRYSSYYRSSFMFLPLFLVLTLFPNILFLFILLLFFFSLCFFSLPSSAFCTFLRCLQNLNKPVMTNLKWSQTTNTFTCIPDKHPKLMKVRFLYNVKAHSFACPFWNTCCTCDCITCGLTEAI